MNVLEVTPKGDKAAMLHMADGSQVWTPEMEKATPLVGKPIPSDWIQKQGDYGPQAFPPREKKGGGGFGAAAFRNTKEGQAYDQERMDRRTALMQAVAIRGPEQAEWSVTADRMYTWLRAPLETAGSSLPSRSRAGKGESTAKANTGGSPPRDAESRSADLSPASPDTWGAAAETLGEGAAAAVSPPSEAHLTKEEQQVFAKAFGGQPKALNAARERFGDRVRGLSDLTRAQALELTAGRVG